MNRHLSRYFLLVSLKLIFVSSAYAATSISFSGNWTSGYSLNASDEQTAITDLSSVKAVVLFDESTLSQLPTVGDGVTITYYSLFGAPALSSLMTNTSFGSFSSAEGATVSPTFSLYGVINTSPSQEILSFVGQRRGSNPDGAFSEIFFNISRMYDSPEIPRFVTWSDFNDRLLQSVLLDSEWSLSAGEYIYRDGQRISGIYLQGTVKMADYTSAAPIPEPSTYALMALGLAAVAYAARRRRSPWLSPALSARTVA